MSNGWGNLSVCGPAWPVIEQLRDEDRRWTLLELEKASDIEKRTVHRILSNENNDHIVLKGLIDATGTTCIRDKRLGLVDSAIILCTAMQDNIKQSVYGSYSEFGMGRIGAPTVLSRHFVL
ncbi:hypothetical protein TNCT_515881 [Trichonephila clavata]|uniref:Uncharacterized protein n=1 Tax=Trichonephila clavata TaxID=2740835 RepID=A0A8X6HIJ1_TRICU|nr:hypothetical protein TNCT_515881 [Trichonephila clavata]